MHRILLEKREPSLNLDDTICYCFHISKRKIVNYLRIHKPRRASQLSNCGSGDRLRVVRAVSQAVLRRVPGRPSGGNRRRDSGRLRQAAGRVHPLRQGRRRAGRDSAARRTAKGKPLNVASKGIAGFSDQQIRNPNVEIRKKSEAPNFKRPEFWMFRVWDLRFPSRFGFRDSCFDTWFSSNSFRRGVSRKGRMFSLHAPTFTGTARGSGEACLVSVTCSTPSRRSACVRSGLTIAGSRTTRSELSNGRSRM